MWQYVLQAVVCALSAGQLVTIKKNSEILSVFKCCYETDNLS